MSTPSTATALAPLDIANPFSYNNYPLHNPHHHLQNHHHPQQQQHQPQSHHQLPQQPQQQHHHGLLATINSHHRLPAPVPHYQPQSPLANASTSSVGSTRTSLSAMASRAQPESATSSEAQRRTRRRTPDWDEFYRNGPPKEIIVIDDSPSPPPQLLSRRHPAIDAVAPSRVVNGTAQYTVAATSAAQPRHADKKRKVQSTQYEPVYGSHAGTQQSYSSTQTPHLNGTYASPTTASAHSSTASINGTTAGTSLGSSVRDFSAVAPASLVNTQKRKRVTRASQAAAAAASTLDAFASYHPPPKPPIKAKDVHVPQISDVRPDPCVCVERC